MQYENGEFYMQGLAWNDPFRIRTYQELINWVNEVGFLPLFSNEVTGFSAEEHVSPNYWWTGDIEQDPWEWREIIARSQKVAYGKFFGNKAGFISKEWLPYFANARRNGYDFDARYAEGLAGHREKVIMDYFIGEDSDGEMVFKEDEILSTDLKKMAGFGKGGLKNYQGIITRLQMQLYLVITDFRRRKNKKGEDYGMSVSVMFPPEKIWDYELVTSAYGEEPVQSWQRIFDRVKKLYPDASDADVESLIGKMPV